MERRYFLQSLAAALPFVSGCVPASLKRPPPKAAPAVLFVPGYHPGGVRLTNEPPDSRRRRVSDGPRTLLTRIAPNGDVRQAVFPIIGHDVAISPDGRVGFLGRMNLGGGEGAAHHVAFDPETLEMICVGRSLGLGWRGGGHAIFLPDGNILCSERAPSRPYEGTPSAHYGRLSVRDLMTLEVLDSFSCQGIDPHEIRLSDDSRTVTVANYGSIPRQPGAARHTVIEPSVTKLDLAHGSLIRRHVERDRTLELRHLAVGTDQRTFVIRARQGSVGEDAVWLQAIGSDPEDLPVDPNPQSSYLPASPLLLLNDGSKARALAETEAPAHLLEGLSVEYDPLHDEFLATFPSSHRLIVFSGQHGHVVRSIDMRVRGLIRPSGLTLVPGSNLYVVAGYWRGLQVMERGTHRLVRRIASSQIIGGHSHMTGCCPPEAANT